MVVNHSLATASLDVDLGALEDRRASEPVNAMAREQTQPPASVGTCSSCDCARLRPNGRPANEFKVLCAAVRRTGKQCVASDSQVHACARALFRVETNRRPRLRTVLRLLPKGRAEEVESLDRCRCWDEGRIGVCRRTHARTHARTHTHTPTPPHRHATAKGCYA
jgi:hypothetical protein